LALTAGLVAVIVIGGGGFMLGQRSTQNRPAPVLPATVVPAPIPSPTQSSSRMLGRADLLALAAEAADATARGDSMPATVRDAVGKPFAISLPFGCEGPAAADSDAPMRWRYDDSAGALRLNITPVTWSPDEWWAGGPPSDAETIEGFWIPRPWTRSETCPASPTPVAPAGSEPVTLPGQTLAIGQVFSADGARHGRRDGKAYSSVLRMGRAQMGGSQGLALRLIGRIGSGPGGTPATCRQPGGADQRPVCLILVSLDELAIADPVSGTVLAAWPTGSLRDADDAR
jgi:hypothetical protein